jgi:hypothetical protein
MFGPTDGIPHGTSAEADWLVMITIAAMLTIVAELIKLATRMKSWCTPQILRFTRLGRGYGPPMEVLATEMPDVHWANN